MFSLITTTIFRNGIAGTKNESVWLSRKISEKNTILSYHIIAVIVYTASS